MGAKYYRWISPPRVCSRCGKRAFHVHYTGKWNRAHKWGKCRNCSRYVDMGHFTPPANFWQKRR